MGAYVSMCAQVHSKSLERWDCMPRWIQKGLSDDFCEGESRRTRGSSDLAPITARNDDCPGDT